MISATVTDDAVEISGDRGPVPWWSFTKTVLAAAALALVGRGQLTLDERLPDRPFTLRHLLQHRSGLPDYGTVPAYHAAVAAGEAPWPADRMLQAARADTLLSPPGARFAYSNIGYMLVAGQIERASGLALGAALEALVLRPLGIAEVGLAVKPEDLAATCWGNARGYDPGWVYHKLLIGPPAMAALLLHRLLAGRLLPPDLLAAMRAPLAVDGVWLDRPWRSAGYGLGLMIGDGVPDGRFVGHTGGGPGSTLAVFAREGGGPVGCTAAVAAALDAPGPAERAALTLVTKH